MKKIGTYLFIFLISVLVFILGFSYKRGISPNIYYKVYLDSEYIGTIKSKSKLEKYINSQAEQIKKNLKEYEQSIDSINSYNNNLNLAIGDTKIDRAKYLVANKKTLNISEIDVDNIKYYIEKKLYQLQEKDINEMQDYIEKNNIYLYADKIYTPNGIEIRKVYTYENKIISVPSIYKKIISKKSCTIAGYKFTIKSKTDGVKDIIIYTLDRNIFNQAIEDLITIFVPESEYKKYKENNQSDIKNTGSIIENIYVNEDITYKPVNISIDEKIYTDSKDLSAYLLYGNNFTEKTVKVNTGDSIESIAFDNQISVQEFLIFNPKYTSRDNLLVAGTDIKISKIDPKLQIVVERYEVIDKETDYSTVEEYDSSISQGSLIVSQEGERGLERVSQNVKSINGEISYVDPVDKKVLKVPVSKIIKVGTRYIPNVGSLASWGWPTNSGYTLSSYYGYRLSVFGEGNFHSGLDIAGTGYGSPVYATNNGVIVEKGYDSKTGYGNYILINHNNGYYSMYAHLSGFSSNISQGSTVERGQLIGYVGTSGWATGPHLHFEIRNCTAFNCHINPLPFLSR